MSECQGRESTHNSSTLQDTTNDPDDTSNDDGIFTTNSISKGGDCERAKQGASRHGCDNCSLSIGTRLISCRHLHPYSTNVDQDLRSRTHGNRRHSTHLLGDMGDYQVERDSHSTRRTWTQCPSRTDHHRCMRKSLRYTDQIYRQHKHPAFSCTTYRVCCDTCAVLYRR